MMDARIELASTLQKIKALIDSVNTEEQRKATITEYCGSMQVGYDQYGNRRVSENLLPTVRKVNALIKSEVIDAVERECAEKRSAVAVEIDALRAILPHLAAKACIELGATVRDLTGGGAA